MQIPMLVLANTSVRGLLQHQGTFPSTPAWSPLCASLPFQSSTPMRWTPPQSPYDPECSLFYTLAARHGLPLRNPLEGLGSVEGCRELLRRAGYTRVQVGRGRCATR